MAASAEEIVGVIFQGKDEVGEVQKRIEKRLGDLDKSARRNTNSIRKSFQNAASSIAVLEGPLGGIAGRVNAIGAALSRVSPGFIALGVATSTAIFSITKGLAVFTQYEHQLSRLNGTLAATDHQSGLTAAQIDALAISLGKATLTSRGEALDAAAVLTTFGTVGSQNFGRVLSAAQDMSEVFKTDLVSSVRLLGRAIEDPANNLEILRRRFPAFTTEIVDNIKQLVDAGKELEAQDAILNIIESKVGGAGKVTGIAAALDTLGEEVRQLGNYLGDEFSPAARAAIGLLTKLFASVNQFVGSGEDIGAMTTSRLEQFKAELESDLNSAQGIVVQMETRMNRIQEAGKQTAGQAPSLVDALTEVFDAGQKAFNIDDLSEARAEYNKIGLTLRSVTEELRQRALAQKAEDAGRAKRLADEKAKQEALRVQTELYEESIRQSDHIMETAKEQERAQRRIDTLVKQSIPDRDKVAAIQKEINDLIEKGATITDDQRTKVLAKTLEDSQVVVVHLGNQIAQDLTGGLREATLEAKNLNDVFNNMLKSFGEAIANKLIFAPFENAAATYLSGLQFGGARAAGGPVSGNKAYLVGENGPELFVPGGNGSIAPNNASGGRTIINVNNYTGQPESTSRSITPSGDELVNIIIGTVNNNVNSGGSIDQNFQRNYGVGRKALVR